MKFVKFRNVTEKESPKKSKGGVFSKNRGANRNQAHLGILENSYRGKGEGKKCSTLLVI